MDEPDITTKTRQTTAAPRPAKALAAEYDRAMARFIPAMDEIQIEGLAALYQRTAAAARAGGVALIAELLEIAEPTAAVVQQARESRQAGSNKVVVSGGDHIGIALNERVTVADDETIARCVAYAHTQNMIWDQLMMLLTSNFASRMLSELPQLKDEPETKPNGHGKTHATLVS